MFFFDKLYLSLSNQKTWQLKFEFKYMGKINFCIPATATLY
jgi:hypothetical protein